MPRSKRSRISSILAPERFSDTKPQARFSSTPRISLLHFAVEWANVNGHMVKQVALIASREKGRNIMNRSIALGLAMLAGVAIGALVINGLQAQGKGPG